MITDVSPARVLLAVLESLSLSASSETADWTGTYGGLPSELPTKRIATKSSTPIVHGKDTDGKLSLHYGVQVFVRSSTDESAYKKSAEIVARLVRITPATKVSVTIDTVQYDVEHVSLSSGPVYLGAQEDKDGERYSTNFLVVINKVG